jgi:hypothetical protein
MMQHTGGNDQIELPTQFTGTLDRQLLDVEIRKRVLLFQLFRVLDARRADVDADDPAVGSTERVSGRLPRAAAGNEDVEVRPIRRVRPHQVVLGAQADRIAPLVARTIQVVYRGRIGVAGVELAHGVSAHLRCARVAGLVHRAESYRVERRRRWPREPPPSPQTF